MDAVKPNSSMPVQATPAPKRPQASAESAQAPRPEASPARPSAYEQPRPTTNASGEKLGQRLNAIA